MGIKNILTKNTELDFNQWLAIGLHNNWIGPPICYTHDGLPTSQLEDQQYDDGQDPCLHILRLYENDVHRITIEDNHSPSIWRQAARHYDNPDHPDYDENQ